MSAVDCLSREDKKKWLFRPIEWAFDLSFSSAFFAVVFWYYQLASDRLIFAALALVIAVNAGLTLWGLKRLNDAARLTNG